jgi:putative Mn2+ efflux pump MntP
MTALFVLAIGLSMDAFAAALSQGAKARVMPTFNDVMRISFSFGLAQALMPLLGWGLGLAFASVINSVDHWVAFALLGVIGAHMIYEGLMPHEPDAEKTHRLASGKTLFVLAIATSIDAAAAGVTLALLGQPVLFACAVIGLVTLAMCMIGVMLGKIAGSAIGRRAEILGGVVLIGLGTKILIAHIYFAN